MNNRPTGNPGNRDKRTVPSSEKRINKPSSGNPGKALRTDGSKGTNVREKARPSEMSAKKAARSASAKPSTLKPVSKAVSSKPKKAALSPRDAAILAERKRIESIKKKKALHQFTEKFRAVMVFAVIGACLGLAVIFGYIYFNFNAKDKVPDEKVRIILSDDTSVVLEDEHFFYRDGQYYVSLSKVCELSGLMLHGDVKAMTVSFSDNLYATFRSNTNVVEIAGMNCIMTGKSYFEFDRMFIPCSFFSDYCYGITTVHQENGKNKGYNITFDKSFGLIAKSPEDSYPNAVAKQAGDDAGSEEGGIPVFKSNLSAYEMYMNPENSDEYLTLITSSKPLAADYVPSDLLEVSDTRRDGRDMQELRLYAAKSLEAMFIELRALGFTDVSVTSGYRTYEAQADSASCEHMSGLCADLHNLPAPSESFASTEAYKWLYKNCADFGFILRYPKDKTQITGVSFEPWHFRYVGRYHARKIMESGMCLEEYLS